MPIDESSTILIVDDDPYGRDALGMVLGSNGYCLIYAEDGPQGIGRAKAALPDLVLLDVMMPGMDGFSVCRHLRDDETLGEVPILMVTALDDRDSRLEGLRAGADDFITKPIDTVELLARVQGITRLNRYRHLLNQRHQFEWVLDRSDDGYVVLDEHDHVQYSNPKARQFFERNGVEYTFDDCNFLEIVGQYFQCKPTAGWESWGQRPFCHCEPMYLIQPEQGASPALWLQVDILDQVGGGAPKRLVRLQDVSTQMMSQHAMWAFQSTIRHKLNTPLHAMAVCLDLLSAQNIDEVDKDEYQEILTWTQEAMQRLESSVASVLRHAEAPQVAAGRSIYSVADLPANARKLATEVGIREIQCRIENVNVGAVDRPVDLSQAELMISDGALECILIELFENAKKFHPHGDPTVEVLIRYKIGTDGTPMAQIHVTDDGVCLSPLQLEKMWAPYYQSERTFTGEVPGMGLGLSLVQRLLWQVGGHCRSLNRGDRPGVVVEIMLPFHEW